MDNILIYGKDVNTGTISQLQSINNVLLISGGSGSSAPIGSITQYAGLSAPSGWLICNGSAIDRTTYSALFTVISTTYGIGDGSTTFNIPNLSGRVPVGLNSGTFNFLGSTGGEETHTLSVNEMPSHKHTYRDAYFAEADGPIGEPNHAGSKSGYDNDNRLWAENNDSEYTGDSNSHNNLQPYIVLNYIIYTGV